MEIVFALFLIVAPINADGTIGPDEVSVLDSGLTSIDCGIEAFKRSPAAYTLYGPSVIATLSCQPDNAPETWN